MKWGIIVGLVLGAALVLSAVELRSVASEQPARGVYSPDRSGEESPSAAIRDDPGALSPPVLTP